MKKIKIPTGFLFVDEYSNGPLETLSIGDYGKKNNIKADFLGFNKEINGVPNMECMPLSEKWVITLSTQYGCPMKCRFCDVPKCGFHGNTSITDLHNQLLSALKCFHNVKYTDRLNIHFARMGEPIFNDNVFSYARFLGTQKDKIQKETGIRFEVIHPVLTTSMPKMIKKDIEKKLLDWCLIKNKTFNGQAGLQISINSTNNEQRNFMYNNMSMSLEDIAKACENLPEPISRKYCLNFAYASDYEVDGKKLASLFDSNKFMCKITPIHNNNACRENGIETIDGYKHYYPYTKPEQSLKEAGFDVLVFVPSMDEEDGLVTCGNLVLSGTTVKNGTII